MTITTMAVPSSEKLSFWTKAAYAIGDLGNSVGPGTVIPFWYLYFLVNVARLDPALAGITWFVGKTLWDAVNDPLVGLISDRTRTRWGRRRPYLLFGAVPFGLTFALLWIVPPIRSQIGLCAYFTILYILFDTAFTLIGCPYVALTPELTLDHDERTSLTTYRMAVSIGGGLLAALVLGLLVFPAFPENDPLAYLSVGVGCGLLFIPPLLITFLATRERREFQAAPTPSPLDGLRFVLRNRPWRYTLHQAGIPATQSGHPRLFKVDQNWTRFGRPIGKDWFVSMSTASLLLIVRSSSIRAIHFRVIDGKATQTG